MIYFELLGIEYIAEMTYQKPLPGEDFVEFADPNGRPTYLLRPTRTF